MKKNIAIWLAFFSSFVSVYGMSNTSDNIVEVKINELSDSINNLNLKIAKLKENEVIEYEDLNDRIHQASETISNQNSLIDGFGVLYTILTIIIALIGIVLPILTYQFGIKPSQEALTDFEKNAELKIKNYLNEARREQVKKSIEYLSDDNIDLKDQAISFLALTQNEGFTDIELFEFNKLIKSGNLSDTHIATVAYLLGLRVNEFANDIFGNSDILKTNLIKSQAYQYIPKVGIKQFINPLKTFLLDNKNQYGEFYTMLTVLNKNGKDSALELLNNIELVDILSIDTLKEMEKESSNLIQILKISGEEYKKTYLFTKIENFNIKI